MPNDTELINLRRKRGQFKRKVSDFGTFVDALKNKTDDLTSLTVTDIKELETRIERINLLLDQFQEIQDKIFNYEIDEIEENNYISEFEQNYFTVVAEAKTLLENTSLSSNNVASSARSQLSNHSEPKVLLDSVKLPAMPLPKFRGQFSQWLEFHDCFLSLIHNNGSLSDVQRFHYLKASLENEAADIIKSLPLSAANYNIAWALVCKRYTKKKLLIQNHVNEFFKLREGSRESALHLREIADTVTKNMRSLESLGQSVDNWDPMIIHIVLSKLDNWTIKAWESHKTAGELPTINELLEFLCERADMLEKLSLRNNNKKGQNDFTKGLNKSFFVSKPSCYLCKQPHAIYNCDKFLALSVNDRIKKVSELKLCSNCLRNTHITQNCETRTRGCRTCKKGHNTLLHINGQDRTQTNETVLSEEVSLSAQVSQQHIQVLLATAVVKLRDKCGKWLTCRALLDSASQSNFISSELHRKLGLRTTSTNISIQGINQGIATIKTQCKISLQSDITGFNVDMNCLIIDKISDNIPSVSFSCNYLNLPETLQLADPLYYVSDKIDILIGAQMFWAILLQGQVVLGKNLPVLQNTQLGWILSGSVPTVANQITNCFLSKNVDIHQQLQRFWELEECPSSRALSVEEQKCETHFIDNVLINQGRYIVSIPFKDSTTRLGESRSIALKRFSSLEKRLHVNSKLNEAYKQFMNEYIALGHMVKVHNPNDNISHFYLPHHGVINESSKTTKLRVVFDASSATSSGVTLNDIQMVGPTLQPTLFNILVRFRQHFVAFSADIQKMYRQVLVNPTDRQYQRILWRENSSQPLDTYELQTVTYGTAAAPYLAVRCLVDIADKNSCNFPEVCNVIKSDFYVDDVLSGAHSTEEAMRICKQLQEVLETSHFYLHKWVSNDSQVMEQFKSSNTDVNIISLGCDEMTKTLGLFWAPQSDTLNYKVCPSSYSDSITKRQILSTLSQVFDPLGLLSPSIVIGKTIMQLLWQEKLGWDDNVPKSICERWSKFHTELAVFNELKIERKIVCEKPCRVELHGFSDASELAYSAGVYCRSLDSEGNVLVTLICAKSKVAPLKRLTIPRLELCGAHLLIKLIVAVKESLRVKIDHSFLWTDSTIVLGWINTSPSILKVFVGHRVANIQSNLNECSWSYVPTADNPADLGSRGVFPCKLKDSNFWWHGPSWLKLDSSFWPRPIVQTVSESLPEIKRMEVSFLSLRVLSPIQITRFSNYNRLIRATAYCFRFINNCRKNSSCRIIGPLTLEEIDNALLYIIKVVQKEEFSKEIHCIKQGNLLNPKSKIISFNPFLDSNGVLRIGGRLQASNLSFDQRHPILLPKHHFSKILFDNEHKRFAHAGPQLLLSLVRDKYWPLNGKNYSKLIVHKCVRCFKCKPSNKIPKMGNLPADRVVQAMPFQIVGVDYAGPLNIKEKISRGGKTLKCYVALFICFVTKAIHLEVVSSLSTEAFLASLKRFIARRGKPSKIYSDNGSNFVGAQKELKVLLDLLKNNGETIHDNLALEGISWSFIPPNSPHHGGLWESGVKGVKFHLKRVASNALLTFEQLCTLLTQVESILNSRPLTQLSSDPSDLEPITPSHFLIGRKLTSVSEPSLLHIQENRLSVYQRIQNLVNQFWRRWKTEYLHSLQQRKKWYQASPNMQIGTMVLLQVENVPPLSWPVGRIIKVFPGTDGTVRVVSVQTVKGIYKRSVTKVFPLPIE